MYIIKNALRCIARSKGRNVLIGIIALVIAVSACIGLSIRQASENAKDTALAGMQITATISFDRSGAMNQMGGGFPGGMGGGGFNRDEFANMMGGASSLTLEEYLKYAEAESVQDFYYTLTGYFNGTDTFLPVSDETSDDSDDTTEESDGSGFPSGFPGGMGGMMGGMFSSGDFTIVGYSSDSAMTAFVSGNASILEGGSMFEEGTSEYVCVISQELAIYNGLEVGGSLYYDIAVLWVEDSEILRSSHACQVKIANSDAVAVGDSAIAIGNAQGYGISASCGIVSVDSEYITMTAADGRTSVSFRVFRVDTAVNSGNSGGGLFDGQCRLIRCQIGK